MKRYLYAVVTAVILGSMTTGAAAQTHRVKYAYGSVSLSFLPIYLAEDLGYMKEAGIQADISVIQGGSGPATAAAISGNIDFFVGLLFLSSPCHREGAASNRLCDNLEPVWHLQSLSQERCRKSLT